MNCLRCDASLYFHHPDDEIHNWTLARCKCGSETVLYDGILNSFSYQTNDVYMSLFYNQNVIYDYIFSLENHDNIYFDTNNFLDIDTFTKLFDIKDLSKIIAKLEIYKVFK